MKPLRMGIIGAGAMGNKHARDIRQRTDAEVIAVCDPNKASIERITETLGITTSNIRQYSELSEMLGKDGFWKVVTDDIRT